MVPECTDFELTEPYIEFAIAVPLFITLQLLILTRTFWYECQNNKKYPKSSKARLNRICFILMQCLGLIWTIEELLRFVIDPYTNILQDNIGCQITAYIPKILAQTYASIYSYQILLRLNAFNNSYLELSRCKIKTFSILILGVLLTFTVPLFIILDPDEVCIANIIDLGDNHKFCAFPLKQNSNVILMIYAAVVYFFFFDVIFSVIFCMKLNKLLSKNKENEKIQFKFKNLIVKNCILTVFGSCSTVINWISWIYGNSAGFLYLDLFIKALVIALMFKYNERYYERICKCCIWICFNKCDKSGQNFSFIPSSSKFSKRTDNLIDIRYNLVSDKSHTSVLSKQTSNVELSNYVAMTD